MRREREGVREGGREGRSELGGRESCVKAVRQHATHTQHTMTPPQPSTTLTRSFWRRGARRYWYSRWSAGGDSWDAVTEVTPTTACVYISSRHLQIAYWVEAEASSCRGARNVQPSDKLSISRAIQ